MERKHILIVEDGTVNGENIAFAIQTESMGPVIADTMRKMTANLR